jgi:hypothetical protein
MQMKVLQQQNEAVHTKNSLPKALLYLSFNTEPKQKAIGNMNTWLFNWKTVQIV